MKLSEIKINILDAWDELRWYVSDLGWRVRNTFSKDVSFSDGDYLPELDFKEISRFGEMSKFAYLSDDTIRDKYGKNLITIEHLEKTEGLGYIVKNAKNRTVTIVARGTDNIKNWVIDAEFRKEYDDKAEVYLHHGFKKSAEELYEKVLPILEEYNKKGWGVEVTGHSLGGAMAAIIMIYLDADGFSLGRTITFGQPKVTNSTGMKKFRDFDLLRVINREDLVPLVPPLILMSLWHGVYRHFGIETILLRDNYVVYLNEKASEKFGVTSFWGNITDINANDHPMDRYLQAIGDKTDEYEVVPYKDRDGYM